MAIIYGSSEVSRGGRMTRKVALVGPHGTGKTTLAKKLGKILELPVLPEMAREALERAGVDWKGIAARDKEAFKLWEAVLYEAVLALHRKDMFFVADRSLVDVVAYTEVVLGPKAVGGMFPGWKEDLRSIGYSALVYCGRPYRPPDTMWAPVNKVLRRLLQELEADEVVRVIWLEEA